MGSKGRGHRLQGRGPGCRAGNKGLWAGGTGRRAGGAGHTLVLASSAVLPLSAWGWATGRVSSLSWKRTCFFCFDEVLLFFGALKFIYH